MCFPDLFVINLQDFNIILGIVAVFVDPDDDVFAPVDSGLFQRRGFLNPEFGNATFDGLGHTAQFINLGDQGAPLLSHFRCQCLHHVGAAPGIHHLTYACFLLQYELGIAGNPGGKFRWQGYGLVEGVGVQGLRATKHRRHGFNRGAYDVVVGVLLGQGPARGLAVGAQHGTLGIAGPEFRDNLGPEQTCSPHLGNLHVEIHADTPEKRQAGCKVIYAEARRQGGTDIFLAVGEGVGHFQRGVGPGFLHVIARNGNGIETGHVPGAMGDDVTDNSHAGCRGVNVGIAHHEFFQDVVLDSPRQLRLPYTLLFCRHHITGQYRQHSTVHGHGD